MPKLKFFPLKGLSKKQIIFVIGIIFCFLSIILAIILGLKAINDSFYVKHNLVNNGLICSQKNGKYGYYNDSGDVKIDFFYDEAFAFNNNVAIVRLGKKYYLINKKGHTISLGYDKLINLGGNELFSYYENDKCGLITSKGVCLTDALFIEISSFSCGLARIFDGEKYGFINEKGKIIIDKTLSNVSSSFVDGYIIDKDNNRILNTSGTATLDNNKYKYENLVSFDNLVISSFDNHKFLQTVKGTILTDGYLNISETVKKGYLIAEGTEENVVLNSRGKVRFRTTNKIINIDHQGFIFVQNQENHIIYIYNLNGKKIREIPVTNYEFILDFTKGSTYIVDKQDTKTVIYGSENEITLPADFEVLEINNEMIVLSRYEKKGVMSFNKTVLVDFNYDELTITSDGFAVTGVKYDSKVLYGIIKIANSKKITGLYNDKFILSLYNLLSFL